MPLKNSRPRTRMRWNSTGPTAPASPRWTSTRRTPLPTTASRSHQPEYRHGLLRDNLTAEFHDQWRAQGGSEEAWLAANPSAASPDGKAILAKDAAAAKKPDAQGDWRNAPKNLLSFQLSDFSGKTWGLKDFSGEVGQLE